MRRTRWLMFSTVVAIAAAACGGKHLDLGAQSDAGADTVDGSGGSPGPTSTVMATYEGYVEAYTFRDGSDTVAMKLTYGDGGAVTGSVTFGNAPMLPPPTDPNVGYPPGWPMQMVPCPNASPPDPHEGVAFTVLEGHFDASRLTFLVQPKELWKAWCELQSPHPQYSAGLPDGGGCGELVGYGCLPSGGGGPTFLSCGGCTMSEGDGCDGGGPTAIDCVKLSLCGEPNGPCTCTAQSCTVTLDEPNHLRMIAFDVRATTPDALEGSVKGLDGDDATHPVHLTRKP